MRSFIPIVIAHDATCKKGDEWLFHGEVEIEDAIIGCVMFCIMLLVGIGFGIYYLITH